MRILIVEDDADVRDLLVLMVGSARLGDRVDSACDGEEAVRLVRDGADYDLAILDVMMPRMDGEDAARAILALAPLTVVCFLTGYSLSSEKATRLRLMGEVWQKPGALDGLGERVGRALERRSPPPCVTETETQPCSS